MQYVYGYIAIQLGFVCEYGKRRISNDALTVENYVSVENLLQEKKGKKDSENLPIDGQYIEYLKNDTLLGNIRPYLKKIWYADRNGGTNGDVLVIRVQESCQSLLLPRYLYHCLANDGFFHYNVSHSKGAKMPRGDKEAIMEYIINIPSVEEQVRIAGILDRFDKLCNDISGGLPAEIEARQRQYEYYRDKLLNFNKLS